jgi:hypothetical protein
MKKKVRYAAGALGALGVMPALGLAALPATAATHAPAGTGKTVRTVTAQLPNAPAAVPCQHKSTASSAHGLNAFIKYSQYNGCIGYLTGTVIGNHLKDVMRLRYYNHGTLAYPTSYDYSDSYGGDNLTTWFQYSDVTGVSKVCEAIMSSQLNKVKFGPTCLATGYTGPPA